MWAPRALFGPVAWLAARYIAQMRRHYYDRSRPINAEMRRELHPFFSPDTLDAVRTCVLRDESIPDPAFYPLLRVVGFRDLPSFRQVAAVTFQDVIVGQEQFTPRLLFHEMVHAEQYRQLGLKRFAYLYVSGFVRGGGYEGIPLEQQAYALDSRFARNGQHVFRVDAEVRSWIASGKY